MSKIIIRSASLIQLTRWRNLCLKNTIFWFSQNFILLYRNRDPIWEKSKWGFYDESTCLQIRILHALCENDDLPAIAECYDGPDFEYEVCTLPWDSIYDHMYIRIYEFHWLKIVFEQIAIHWCNVRIWTCITVLAIKSNKKKWLDIPKKNASINHWNFQMKIQRMLLSFTNHIKGTNTTFRIYFVQRLIVYSGPRNLQEITSKTWLNFSRKISWYHRFREKSKLANIFWMMVQEGYIGTKNRDWKTNSSGTKPGFNIFSVHNLNIEPCLEPLRN